MASDSAFGTIPSFGNTNCVRHIKVDLKNEIATLVRRDKTGSRTATIGVRGRSHGTWSYEGSLAPSGTPGTAPDFEPLLVALYGGAPTVGGTRVYGPFVDQPITTFSLASYRQPSTLNQKIAFGCVPNEITFNLGQDIAEFSASGECKFVLESDYFSSASTDEKGGLGAFPAEPGSPVTHGGIIAGFTGSVLIGGASQTRIRTAQVKINNGADLVKDTFGFYLPTDTEGDIRVVTVSFTLYEDDSAGQEAIRTATITKTPLDVDLTLGTNSGSIFDMFLKNVQLQAYTSDDSARRYSLTIPDSRAFGTSITSRDEVTITIS
jgi:hypothetical protein